MSQIVSFPQWRSRWCADNIPEIKITPERIYALGFHPTEDKPLIFAGDKMGNLGIFDASQTGPEVKAEDNDDDEEDADTPEPAITAFKVHSRTITSFVFPANGNSLYSSSYDSSVRKLDLEKGVAVEVFAPESLEMDMPISSIAIPSAHPNMLMFSVLDGSFGRHDMRTPSDTEIWQLTDKKIGGFSLYVYHASSSFSLLPLPSKPCSIFSNLSLIFQY